jgi:predicted transcriptional regulator
MTVGTIPNQIRARRAYLALTQMNVCEMSDVSYPTIMRAEKGSDINLSSLVKIADALGCDVVLRPRPTAGGRIDAAA